MSNSTEKFWIEKKEIDSHKVYEQNKLLKQTLKDAKSIASDKHPKALYTECLQ